MPAIRDVQAVGRYAIGVTWSDGHDSIYPFDHLRRACACDECEAKTEKSGAPTQGLTALTPIAEASVMLHWGDDHETLLLMEELRALCSCAHCKGEPNYPITNQ